MLNIVEIPTGTIVTTVQTVEEGLQFIETIESFEGYKALKKIYGDTRRIQQELAISSEFALD